ncbi:hypothetical protein K469DRAFT_743635 [Zopfia rhizophila CBS 207.26]|uniref:Homeobox domain-containing protein n=1 Tax=Zopfia rhizophila CBS 207.26 TaxID=1314779 RepID=A0A6A6ERX6_9PEZI|nr:hypothetical protein K469DRAFT_743635 [Zopfia rhizophila CBS 207.26]
MIAPPLNGGLSIPSPTLLPNEEGDLPDENPNPVPASSQINMIARQTNLEAKRVRNWFNNARLWKKLRPKLPKESLERLSQESDSNSNPQMEAYLDSSVEDKPVVISAIEAADTIQESSEQASNFDSTRIRRLA